MALVGVPRMRDAECQAKGIGSSLDGQGTFRAQSTGHQPNRKVPFGLRKVAMASVRARTRLSTFTHDLSRSLQGPGLLLHRGTRKPPEWRPLRCKVERMMMMIVVVASWVVGRRSSTDAKGSDGSRARTLRREDCSPLDG